MAASFEQAAVRNAPAIEEQQRWDEQQEEDVGVQRNAHVHDGGEQGPERDLHEGTRDAENGNTSVIAWLSTTATSITSTTEISAKAISCCSGFRPSGQPAPTAAAWTLSGGPWYDDPCSMNIPFGRR